MRGTDPQRIIDQINKKFSEHEKVINELSRSANTMHNFVSSKQHVEDQVAINAAVFDKMNAYLNVIVFSGYAGFFAIWSFTNQYLSGKASVLTALLLGISLFFFIFWEVVKSMIQSRAVMKMYKLDFEDLPPHEYHSKIEDIKKKNRKWEKRLVTAWPFFAFVTVVFGLSGGALLAYNFFANLIEAIPNWPV